MSKRRGSAGRRAGGRVTPKGTRPGETPSRHEPDLLDELAEAIEFDHPIDLMHLTSQILEACTERPADRYTHIEKVPRAEFLDSMLPVDLPETTALLTMAAVLLGEHDVATARIRREVAGRELPACAWLGSIGAATPTEVWRMGHVLGDGENIMVGVRWPDGQQLTAVTLIDHNAGGALKDAYLLPVSPAELVAEFQRIVEDPEEMIFERVDPAEARGRITGGIHFGAITVPPYVTETWPSCRYAVEWVTRHLPDGYDLPERELIPPAARATMAEEFLASEYGMPVATSEPHVAMLHELITYGCDAGIGDPHRWSDVRVEILLADWAPRCITAEPDALAVLPDLTRRFVRYSHERAGISEQLTNQTLETIDAIERDYQATVSAGRTPDAG